MRGLVVFGLCVVAMAAACSGNRVADRARDGVLYERDCNGTALSMYVAEREVLSLISRVAAVMTKDQLLRLEHLVAQGSVSSAVLGYANVGDTAALNRLMAEPNIAEVLEPEVRLLWAAEPETHGTATLIPLYALKLNDGKAAMEGRMITHAVMTKDEDTDGFAIEVTMTDSAADEFARLTRENIGRQIAVAIDGKVVMALFVQSEVPGGQISITTGTMTEERVREIVDRL